MGRALIARRAECLAPALARSQEKYPASELDDAAGHADLPFLRDRKTQPASSTDRFALIDRQPLRQVGVCREEPATEIGARRAGARILDHRFVLTEEEARQYTITLSRKHVCHRAVTVASVRRKSVGARRRAADRVEGRERDHKLVAAGVDP